MSSETTHVDPASPGSPSDCRCSQLALEVAELRARLEAINPEPGHVRGDVVEVVDHQGVERVRLYAPSGADDMAGVTVYDPGGNLGASLYSTALFPHGEDAPGVAVSAVAFGAKLSVELGIDGDSPVLTHRPKGRRDVEVARDLFGDDRDTFEERYHPNLTETTEAVNDITETLMLGARITAARCGGDMTDDYAGELLREAGL
jgi:hypothetical protein